MYDSLLDQEETDDRTSDTEHMETQPFSEEQLLEHQFNDVVLELNLDTR